MTDTEDGYPGTVAGLGYRFDHHGCSYGKETREQMEKLQTAISKAVWIVVAAGVVSAFALISSLIQVVANQP